MRLIMNWHRREVRRRLNRKINTRRLPVPNIMSTFAPDF